MTSPFAKGWTLYTPILPSNVETPIWGESLNVLDIEIATDGFHEGGWFLPEAEIDGWRFGVSQARLSSGRVHAFVRLPSNDEVSIVCDPHAEEMERLDISTEPGYLGAFKLRLNPEPVSREALVSALHQAFPKLKAEIETKPVGPGA